MKSIKFAPIFVFLIIFSMSCAFLTQSILGGGGPKGFTAEVTSYGSVKLTWQAVEGAQSYLLEQQLDGPKVDGKDYFIPVAELGPDQTSYEDYMALEESTLIYRVQATVDSKTGGTSSATVTTPAVVPNPLTVTATFDEKKTVTQSIGPEGGTVSLADKKSGATYELDVPAGAVLNATDFTLTPLTDIGDWPLDGPTYYSVRVGPENLDLYANLSLKISLPDPLTQDDSLFPVGFGFDGTGEEFHLFLLDQPIPQTSYQPNGGGILAMPMLAQYKEVIVQPVQKDGTQGVGWGSRSKIIEITQQNLPTDAGARSQEQAVTQQTAQEDLPPLPINPKITARNLHNLTLQILNADDAYEIKGKKTDCATASKMMDRADALYQQGLQSDTNFGNNQDMKNISEWLSKVLDQVIQETISKCEASKPGKPPKGYGCTQKLLYKLSHPIIGQSLLTKFGVTNSATFGVGGKENSPLFEYQRTLKNKCGPPAYRVVGGTNSPDPICDLTKPFTLVLSGDQKTTFNFDSGGAVHMSVLVCTYEGVYSVHTSDDQSSATISYTLSSGSCLGAGGSDSYSHDIQLIAVPDATCPEK